MMNDEERDRKLLEDIWFWLSLAAALIGFIGLVFAVMVGQPNG